MASVTTSYRFADGDSIHVTAEVESTFPDALDECRATAVRAFREAMADGIAAVLRGEDEDE